MATPERSRKLSTHQKTVLIQVLLVFPNQHARIIYSPDAGDGHNYAQEFLAIFKAIGWDVEGPETEDSVSAQPHELAIIAHEPDSLPPAAEALRDALLIYKIEASIQFDPSCNIPPGAFVLAIGP